jgi:ribonuclease P protein component
MDSTTPAGQSPAGQSLPLRGTNEANVSTEQPTTETHARLPRSHGHPRRPSGAETPARQRAQAPDRQHSGEATRLTRASKSDTLVGAQKFPKTKRIRKRGEFLKLQRVGRRRAGTRFVVITAPCQGDVSRLGITASRRVGGAVVRNRVKRLVREFFRQHHDRIRPPRDVLVIVRPEAAGAEYSEVKRELGTALRIDACE